MKKAFTLIELLVVIAIIAILAAMLMPALTKARIEAKKANCKSNQHTWGLNYTMYLNDFNGWYPTALDPSGGVSGSVQTQGDLKECLGALYPEYLVKGRIFMCPGKQTSPAYDEDGGDAADESTVTNTGYTVDIYIPRTADPARAIFADVGTFNHPNGANILFSDTHVKWAKENGPPKWQDSDDSLDTFAFDGFVVPNEYMTIDPMEDTDVYECGNRAPTFNTTDIPQRAKYDCDLDGQD